MYVHNWWAGYINKLAIDTSGNSCTYEDGEGSEKIKVNIPDGKSKMIDCNTCTCSDGVLACTEIACGNLFCRFFKNKKL
jgi:hypothetical protein